MKSAFFFAPALLALGLTAATATTATATDLRLATQPKDTITIRLPNKVVMTLLVRDAAQLRQLKEYHLDSLTSRLGTYITQAEAAAKNSKTERVTVEFYPDKDQPGQNLPEQVRITTSKAPNRNRVEVMLNKRFGMTVTTDEKGEKSYDFDSNKKSSKQTAKADSIKKEERRYRSSTSNFRLDVGLNTLVNTQAYTTPAGLQPGTLELRPAGSRYVNIGWAFAQRLGGKRSPFYLSVGPEFSFNNYMLEGNNKWVNVDDKTQVVGEVEGRELQKSKLATTTLNVPLMLTMDLRNANGRTKFKLGAGGFAGYLLGEHSKVKYFQNGDSNKEKDRGSFNLNDFQYGVQGTLGIGSLTLFTKYNLNELFKENRGPQAQTLSFGLTLGGI